MKLRFFPMVRIEIINKNIHIHVDSKIRTEKIFDDTFEKTYSLTRFHSNKSTLIFRTFKIHSSNVKFQFGNVISFQKMIIVF